MNLCPTCGVDWDQCREIIAEARSGRRGENTDILELITSNCRTCRKELRERESENQKTQTEEIQSFTR
jgi:hypothetical protein